jgi:hypothetical protein
LVADFVMVVAMWYVEKGLTAEKKLRELEEKHAEQNHEMIKDEKLAQKSKKQHDMAEQKHKNKHSKRNTGGGGGGGKINNNYNIGSKKD